MKTDVAVRRPERLEKENDEQEEVTKLVVEKSFVEKGFGVGKVHTSEIVFIHASAVEGTEVLMIGTDAWVQVVSNDTRTQGRYRARRAWRRTAWKEEKDKERANKVAQQVRRAAALTARPDCASTSSLVSRVCGCVHRSEACVGRIATFGYT